MTAETPGIENDYRPEFSTAGFFAESASPRVALNFNVGWRFWKGALEGAHRPELDDSAWAAVNVPHGLELLPLGASGSKNYQGEAWYRKRFVLDSSMQGKRIVLHFEAVMGKTCVWVNGEELTTHFGGYLPVIVDVTDAVKFGEENVVAVRVDNSDDGSYPPGKPQERLDFTYFGGIYRDVWLVATDPVHVSDPNTVGVVAGGGVFVHCKHVSETSASVDVSVHVVNESGADHDATVEIDLRDRSGKTVGTARRNGRIACCGDRTFELSLDVASARLWHVDDPYLHDLVVRITDGEALLDSLRLRVGLRSVEFRNGEGFFLNGKRFRDKLVGGNRHQDFAHVGNALPNTTHWRDARKLREAGMRVIRSAHYPQDPAFMDACDELGLLVIVATPGWQFWNDDPAFAELVVEDIRNMVRRDRNHPCAFLWEPILNESSYPAEFAQRVHDTVHEEYPFPGCYTAADDHRAGGEVFDVRYAHPFADGFWREYNADSPETRKRMATDYGDGRCVFTREWGDAVDDFHAHNSPSRVAKGWGEVPQVVQLHHYANPDYIATSWDALYDTPALHVGGALWHSFDHQRGYHPDPFWGGIMDAYRQPKFSYYMFKSQVPVDAVVPHVPTGPFVYIAHEMTPFSPPDITVVSNCDEVRLRVNGQDMDSLGTHAAGVHMPRRPLVFKGAYTFMTCKGIEGNKFEKVKIQAEGLIDGEVVVRAERMPSRRPDHITLTPDYAGAPLVADGSDFVPVVAHIADAQGVVKRLTDETIRFRVEGAGELIDDGECGINPQKMQWGEAVALVRAGTTPGAIRVYAELARQGINTPRPAELVIESVPVAQAMV